MFHTKHHHFVARRDVGDSVSPGSVNGAPPLGVIVGEAGKFVSSQEGNDANLAHNGAKDLLLSQGDANTDSNASASVGTRVSSDSSGLADAAPNFRAKISTRNLTVTYHSVPALHDVGFEIGERQVTALIGPSGCGKSTFLRCINRMNDYISACNISGDVTLNGFGSIYRPDVDVVTLRARVGMVFQSPNPFPKSIYDNVAYGPRIHGLTRTRAELDGLVEHSLRSAGLWSEVGTRLNQPGTSLSGGQQQRLCIARAIAVSPEVILMDEPCSALDPIATGRIEELIKELAQDFTIVIVTHSMSQARRVSDRTAFFHMGEVAESGSTGDIFGNPQNQLTQDYIMGRTG